MTAGRPHLAFICSASRSSAMIGLLVVIVLLAVVAIFVVVNGGGVWRTGHGIPGPTVVRCSEGHLFTTTSVEGASLKAVHVIVNW
jgi:hypothetical protein